MSMLCTEPNGTIRLVSLWPHVGFVPPLSMVVVPKCIISAQLKVQINGIYPCPQGTKGREGKNHEREGLRSKEKSFHGFPKGFKG
jgi:hypothetical protein